MSLINNANMQQQEAPPSAIQRNKPTNTLVEKYLSSENRIIESYSNQCFDLFVDSDIIGWLVLNQKYVKNGQMVGVNAIDSQFVSDIKSMLEIVDTLAKQKKIKVLIVTSEKKNSFCVGADVNMMYPNTDEKLAEKASKYGQDAMDKLQALPIPTIAAIHGPALGGGYELCLACNYRVASDNKATVVGLPEVMLGVIPGAGGCVRMPKLIGLQKSLELILPGKTLNSVRAKKLGLVDAILPYEDRRENDFRWFNELRTYAGNKVDKPISVNGESNNTYKPQTWKDYLLEGNPFGRKFVAQMAIKNLDKNTRGKYPAPYSALQAIYNTTKSGVSTQRALLMERQLFGKMAVTPESKNLMSVFFMREQAKNLKKSLGKNIDVKPLPRNVENTICVIGGGVMGSGIAQLFALKNIGVYLKDIKMEFVKNGLQNVEKIFQTEFVKKGRMSQEEALKKIKLIQGGVDYNIPSNQNVQIIVEAAVENMDLKKKILIECENNLKNPELIFATNTSTLSINELASVSKRPDKVVGMHFFNPVIKMPLIEIIRSKQTSDETVAAIYKLSLELGKIPIICNDGPGFIVNRILGIYLTEAGRLINDGGDIEQIDRVLVEQFGMPLGAFKLLDEVGIDVAYHSGETLKVLGDRFHSDKSNNMFDLKKLVDARFFGKKVGKGIYMYDESKKGKLQLNTQLLQLFPGYDPKQRRTLSPEEIIDRCTLLMINEACYILEEGVARNPEDIDVGMIFGTGFPPRFGGLLSYADIKGAKWIVRRMGELEQRLGSSRFKPSNLLIRMAEQEDRFFPNRPQVPFVERTSPPKPKL
ncbi:hypothetical protein ABK040_008179 [Willaertia magna]